MHSTTDKWKMGPGIFMKSGIIILLTFRSEKKRIDLELTPKLHQQSPRIRNNFQYFFQDCRLDHHYNNFHNKISSLFQNV